MLTELENSNSKSIFCGLLTVYLHPICRFNNFQGLSLDKYAGMTKVVSFEGLVVPKRCRSNNPSHNGKRLVTKTRMRTTSRMGTWKIFPTMSEKLHSKLLIVNRWPKNMFRYSLGIFGADIFKKKTVLIIY